MIAPSQLGAFASTVREFQSLGLINKAVIDATAVDIPIIALAKNNIERKERALRQAMVLMIAFVMAPLHAWLISKGFAQRLMVKTGLKTKGLGQRLLQLSYKDLHNGATLKKGVEKLFKEFFAEALPSELVQKLSNQDLTEALRKEIVKQKSGFGMADLSLEGFLFATVGFIKVLFGKLMTGTKQFTGEIGIVKKETLDQIYQNEKQQRPKTKTDSHFKEVLTIGLGIGVPVLLGLMLKRAHLKAVEAGRTYKGFMGAIRKIAHVFDYNYPRYPNRFKRLNIPLLSDAGLVVTALILTTGELASARSKREFKELAIMRNSIDALFFFGTPLFMKALTGSTTVNGALAKVNNGTAQQIRRAGHKAAWMYVLSFLLNLVAVSGIVVLTNQMTRKGVKKAAEKLDEPKPIANVNANNNAQAMAPKLLPTTIVKTVQPPRPMMQSVPSRLSVPFQWISVPSVVSASTHVPVATADTAKHNTGFFKSNKPVYIF